MRLSWRATEKITPVTKKSDLWRVGRASSTMFSLRRHWRIDWKDGAGIFDSCVILVGRNDELSWLKYTALSGNFHHECRCLVMVTWRGRPLCRDGDLYTGFADDWGRAGMVCRDGKAVFWEQSDTQKNSNDCAVIEKYMLSVLCKGLIRDRLWEVWPLLSDILHDRKSIDEFKKLKFPDDAE